MTLGVALALGCYPHERAATVAFGAGEVADRDRPVALLVDRRVLGIRQRSATGNADLHGCATSCGAAYIN